MIALIDADLVAFRCAASAENDGEHIAYLRADKLMQDIITQTDADQYVAYLSGKENFRKEINPQYKANRKDMVLPTFLNQTREFLKNEWNVIVTEGYEADDALGCAQTEETVICSLDKDMLMIPGKHFSWAISGPGWTKDPIFRDVSYIDGIKHFYKQMLIGDVADNIKGVDGVGKVKAAKLIDHLATEEEMFKVVFDLYTEPAGSTDERFWTNANCLWIWRNMGEMFEHRSPFH